jgi:hypothetical protein
MNMSNPNDGAMAAKEFLSQAYWIDQRINTKLSQIADLRALADKCTVAYGSESVTHTRSVSSMEDTILKIIDAEKALDIEVDRLVDTKRKIQMVINQVPDADCRLLLEMRYLGMSKWEDVVRVFKRCRTRVFDMHNSAMDMVAALLAERRRIV